MRNNIIVKRYAEAFVAFAKPEIGISSCVDEMKGLKWLLRENPDFERFLETPDVATSKKFALIDRVLPESYSRPLIVFIKHLIAKRRIDLIIEIADYVRLTYSRVNSIDVVLRTTFPLELKLIEQIKASLQEKFGKTPNLYLELDPDLLGGVQIVIGNKIIDGSVKHKLMELRKQLLKVQVAR